MNSNGDALRVGVGFTHADRAVRQLTINDPWLLGSVGAPQLTALPPRGLDYSNTGSFFHEVRLALRLVGSCPLPTGVRPPMNTVIRGVESLDLHQASIGLAGVQRKTFTFMG